MPYKKKMNIYINVGHFRDFLLNRNIFYLKIDNRSLSLTLGPIYLINSTFAHWSFSFEFNFQKFETRFLVLKKKISVFHSLVLFFHETIYNHSNTFRGQIFRFNQNKISLFCECVDHRIYKVNQLLLTKYLEAHRK